MILDVHENDKRIADLNVVLGAEAGDDSASDFEVPFVTQVSEVLKVHLVVGVRALDD